jgi:aminoglycoside phosphotransferase (APT) family kinase protein
VSEANLEFASSPMLSKDLERLGRGRQAELFVWPSGGVLKLFRKPDMAPAQLEAGALYALAPAGLPMPQILGTVTLEHRPGIVMERLIGPDQLTLLGRRPWKLPAAAKALGQLHARLHASVAPKGLRPLRPSLQTEIAASDSVPRDIKALALADLDRLPDGVAICHWDFHPGNVIETADGPKIIDWPGVHCGDRLADVARTLYILQGGALAPGAPFLVRNLRKLTAFARNQFSRRYLSEYRRHLPFEPHALEAWTRVGLTSRLSYGIPEEREHLLGLISRSL